jgi:hypothetical protein
LVIWWNNTFPYDRWWRNKHNVAFMSTVHKDTSQLDIYFEYLEDKLFRQHEEKMIENKEREDQFKKGIILRERDIEEEIDVFELMKRADYSKVNSQIKVEE